MAGFLGNATEVHFPVAGIFHDTKGSNTLQNSLQIKALGPLFVYDEDRYYYHNPVEEKWCGKFVECDNTIEYKY